MGHVSIQNRSVVPVTVENYVDIKITVKVRWQKIYGLKVLIKTKDYIEQENCVTLHG